jgi:hypothetical protein
MNRSGEPEFDSWWEQFLVRLYLPSGQTLNITILKKKNLCTHVTNYIMKLL